MKKILFAAIAASLLSACQTMTAGSDEIFCPNHSGMARHAICIDPSWVLDAVADGEGEKSKVMVVLNADGMIQLKAKALLMGSEPVALQVGHYFLQSIQHSIIATPGTPAHILVTFKILCCILFYY